MSKSVSLTIVLWFCQTDDLFSLLLPTAHIYIIKFLQTSESYLEPSGTSVAELFCE